MALVLEPGCEIFVPRRKKLIYAVSLGHYFRVLHWVLELLPCNWLILFTFPVEFFFPIPATCFLDKLVSVLDQHRIQHDTASVVQLQTLSWLWTKIILI